ncbi:MAG: cupredoxin family protein [Rhodospirillales bacterium]|nr:cupredoxin family protein [Rhodospirillales bacterium]MBO6785854.1 cupredoxin family protein [Rhodospirillales bacterium]
MNVKIFIQATCSIAFSAIIGATSSTAMADAGHSTAKLIGQPGKVADATRTVEVTMYDNYYEPENLTIKEGETVRFVVRNAGGFVHEFNIASPDMHKAHGPEMMMMLEHGVLEPDRINWDAAKKMQASMGHGMHNDPNSVLLEPGKTGEIIWTFTGRATLEFACNVPGHYEAGMVGQVKLTD